MRAEDEVVDRWLLSLRELHRRLGVESDSAACERLRTLRAGVSTGAEPRCGIVGDRVRYDKHGAGFRLCWDGEEIDVDVGSDGLVWDTWRVGRYARLRRTPVDEHSLAESVAAAHTAGMIRPVGEGWYSLA